MKLLEFYRRLYEAEEDEAKGKPKPEPEDLLDVPKPEPEPAKPDPGPEKPDPEPPGPPSDDGSDDPVSPDGFKSDMLKGFTKWGCPFLFNVRNQKQNKLSQFRTDKTNPKWQIQLIGHIEEIDAKIIENNCVEEGSTTEPEKTDIDIPINYMEPQKSETPTTTSINIKQGYEQSEVLPEPIYNLESEISDITTIQTDDLIDNAIIDLDNQILLQDPEIQEKLKELNITSERMAYLLPLTRETRDFMMGMQTQGINLPHLMLMYNNIKTLYPAISQGINIEKNKILPLNKMINYNEFWDWSRQLWDNSNKWLKSKFIGTYPELDRSTLLP